MKAWVTEIEWEEVNWFYMFQDKEISLRVKKLLVFEDGLFSKELIIRGSAAADVRFCLTDVLPCFQSYVPN
jgi:hypothetical protein